MKIWDRLSGLREGLARDTHWLAEQPEGNPRGERSQIYIDASHTFDAGLIEANILLRFYKTGKQENDKARDCFWISHLQMEAWMPEGLYGTDKWLARGVEKSVRCKVELEAVICRKINDSFLWIQKVVWDTISHYSLWVIRILLSHLLWVRQWKVNGSDYVSKWVWLLPLLSYSFWPVDDVSNLYSHMLTIEYTWSLNRYVAM